jgi:putative glutathione S-transferase
MEKILENKKFLAGDKLTLSDIRLWVTLVRFDEVYTVYFKTNKKRIIDYPNLLKYCKRIY